MNKKVIAILKFIVLLSILLIPFLLWKTNGDLIRSIKTVDDIENLIMSSGNAPLVFFGLQVLQIVVAFIPGEIFQVAAGYLFSPALAILITVSGCIAGSVICFFLARFLGQSFLRLFFDEKKMDYYRDFLNSDKALLICFLLFLIPGIPKDLLNYAAGASEINFSKFIILSTLGRLPAMLASILMGSLAESENYTMAMTILAVALLILVTCFIFRKKIMEIIERKKQTRF